MFSGRKGISPLIATVVLIAFAVALGAVVMNWGRAYVTSTGMVSVKGCSGVAMGIHSVDGDIQLKTGGSGKDGFIEVILENLGSINIDGARVWVLGEKGSYKYESKDVIEPGYPLTKKISYDYDTYGAINQISFTPMVIVDKKPIACPGGKAEYKVK